jgi:hypothetical protein
MPVSLGIMTLMPFGDHHGLLVEQYMSKGTTVTSALYCSLLNNHLRPAMRSKHWVLSTGVLLLCYNPRLSTVCVTAETIRDISFWVSASSPQSPDFAPCEYCIFRPPKEALGGKTFRSDEVQRGGAQVATHAAKGFFYSLGIWALVKRQRTWHWTQQDCVEKWQSSTKPVRIKLAGK